MCGADFPLKVSALGEAPALGYVEEPVRPPGSIAGASRPQPEPRWPISQQQYPRRAPRAGAPMSIEPPGVAQPQAIRSSRCSARRRPICRRRRIGSAAAASRLTIRRRRRRSAAPVEPRSKPKSCRPMRGPARHRSDRRNPRGRCPGFAAARSAAQSAACRRDADRGETGGDAGVPDRVGARSLVRQRGAAGGAASGSTSRWSRSSRSRPIPAAA